MASRPYGFDLALYGSLVANSYEIQFAFSSFVVSFLKQNHSARPQGRVRRRQKKHADFAKQYASKATRSAEIANIPIPEGVGQTLYQAIDECVKDRERDLIKNGKPTEWGKVAPKDMLRLKNSHADYPLEQVNFNTVQEMTRYWTARPNRKNTSKSISIDTVKGQMKALRRMFKWVSSNPDFQWRLPDGVEEAWKVDYGQLMTNDKIAAISDGVKFYKPDELVVLYEYATDFERVLLLLGLNCGFAQAEISSFRKSELSLGKTPAKIERTRIKSKIHGKLLVWPETAKALD